MADWKTYAKAARNTARRQAPGAKQAVRRAGDRAGGYARAASKAIDEGWREQPRDRAPHEERDRAPRDERDRARREDQPRQDRRPSRSGSRTADLRRDAAAAYVVAGRRVERADLVGRTLRALRDAVLIGVSLMVIWGVLFAAGIPISPLTMLIAVGVITVLSFASGMYASSRRAQQAAPDDEA